MPLTLKEIKEFQDKGFTYSTTTRKRASNDAVFYYVTQWDDPWTDDVQLGFKGEFNILRKAGRDISADLAANPVQVDFVPKDEDREDAGDTIDGMYRADLQNNTSLEAFSNAEQEMIVGGFAAWELYVDYESIRSEDNNQTVMRRPIYEANNTTFFDPDAKSLDKADADWCSILTAHTDDGYKKLAAELTGEDQEDITPESFSHPEISYTFPWINEGSTTVIYVSTFYHREIVKKKVFNLEGPLGHPLTAYEDNIEKVMDEMGAQGYTVVSEKEIKKWQATKYIVSGKEILNGEVDKETGERAGEIIAGENIPVIPVYGEYAIIEDEMHYEGITRLAKDPQRLRNFQMSYLADMVSKSPREKPIYTQEQIGRYAHMHSLNGADNNFAYLLLESHGADKQRLPTTPMGYVKPPDMPMALIQSIALSREAVEDGHNPALPQSVSDSDLTSSKAIYAMQARIDKQSAIYREHMKHAKRRDGEVYASMKAEITDSPRSADMVLPDGTRKRIQVMDQVIDEESGEIVKINDIFNAEFKVFSTIGPDYSTKREQTIERLQEMIRGVAGVDPAMHKILMLKVLKLMEGVDSDDIREYANKELVLLGVKKPETDEEKEMLAQNQQQGEEPSAEMLVGMGEKMKGEAALLEQKRKGIEMQLVAQDRSTDNEVNAFEAETKRMSVQIDAFEANFKIAMGRIESFSKQIENSAKLKEQVVPVGELGNEELMAELGA